MIYQISNIIYKISDKEYKISDIVYQISNLNSNLDIQHHINVL